MKLSAQLQGLGLEELAKKARELENAIDVYEAIKDVSLTKDLDRIMELEETLMLAWSYLDPECHNICWDKCEKLLEGGE